MKLTQEQLAEIIAKVFASIEAQGEGGRRRERPR